MRVTDIGYDPGTTYYSVTYRIGGGPEQTAKLSALRAKTEGMMTRGMIIHPDAVRLYRAALAAAEADYLSSARFNFGSRPKREIA